MRFDNTNGKKARYIVSLYGWNVDDRHYYHYYKDAKEMFEKIKVRAKDGCAASIYDLEKDERKAFAKG